MAAFVLLLASRAVTGNALRRLDGRRRLGLLAAGVVLAAHFAFFVAGLLATSLAAAAALVSLEPLAVVVAAWLSFGDKPTPREQVGLGLAMGGAVLVGSSAGQGEHRLLGDALVLVAVVLFGAYVALARGLRSTMRRVYALVAVTLPIGSTTLAWREATFAEANAWKVATASSAVNAAPLWNRSPWRSVTSRVSGSSQ